MKKIESLSKFKNINKSEVLGGADKRGYYKITQSDKGKDEVWMTQCKIADDIYYCETGEQTIRPGFSWEDWNR